ncbi:hypothetical protein [Roseibium polysiphoniae]|uniref:hypothetical protein n=1 Tax=Roseibium polysiphoniae TaxID=2571221 RepID=UPI0032990EDD
MSSTSSGVERARWGQAPLELATNYAQIKEIIDNSPSLRAAFAELKSKGLVTVKYDAFVRSWKKIRSEKEQAASETESAAIAQETIAQAKVSGRKSLHEIRPFSVPTGDEGVKGQW